MNRIIELCFAKDKGKQEKSGRDEIGGRGQTPETLVDKLTLIKSYEQTLRNQGLLPVEDSRIYKLMFRVVHETE